MLEPINKKKKTVSFSQFSNFFTCQNKWYRDYILKEKVFEDNLIMSFGTAIHETVQTYIRTLYTIGEKEAELLPLYEDFKIKFSEQIKKKRIPHTEQELVEFHEDGLNILNEFKDPVNRMRFFPVDKWELVGIELELNENIVRNTKIVAYLDLVLKNKMSGEYKIIDFKTSTMGWKSEKEDFAKYSQLVLYKALLCKSNKIPLNKINVEFFILKRKLYNSPSSYEQSRLQLYNPPASSGDVSEVISEFQKFVEYCFNEVGEYNTDIKYKKNPGEKKKNCKYCQYLKSGKCNGKED